MMGKMVKNMIYFVVLLLVVLMSFGVCRQSILYPDKEPNWVIVRDVSKILHINYKIYKLKFFPGFLPAVFHVVR